MAGKINKDSVKKIFSGAILLITAVAAFGDVFDKDRKDKEFEQMKKDIKELKGETE